MLFVLQSAQKLKNVANFFFFPSDMQFIKSMKHQNNIFTRFHSEFRF